MNSLNLRIFTWAALFAMVSLSGRVAHAYCTNSRTWSSDPVPVWLVTSGDYDVTRTGLALHTIRNYTESALEEWNEASGINIRVRYAGEQSRHDHDEGGITIYATSCDSTACGSGRWLGCTYGSVPNVRIALFPTGCSARPVAWTVTPPGNDLQGVLAHEIGHALGLNHSNTSCSTSQSGTTRGVMRSWLSGAGAFRWLWRDDIAGISAKYGTRDRTVRYRTSTDGANWGGESTLVSNLAHTPISATSSRYGNDYWVHGIAWADQEDRVTHLTGTWSGWYTGALGWSVDSSANGKTWSAPAIAQAPGRVMVAWLSDESTTTYDVTTRWGIRDTGGTFPFSYVDGPVTRRKVLGLSYVADRNLFVLSYLAHDDNSGHILTIAPDSGVPIADTAILAPGTTAPDVNYIFHELGSPACAPGSGGTCIVPMATSGPNGPCLGWIVGTVNSFGSFETDERRVDCWYSFGTSDLALDTLVGAGGLHYLGSFAQATSHAWVYRLPSPYSWATDVVGLFTDYWPIGVGTMNQDNSLVKYRAYYAR